MERGDGQPEEEVAPRKRRREGERGFGRGGRLGFALRLLLRHLLSVQEERDESISECTGELEMLAEKSPRRLAPILGRCRIQGRPLVHQTSCCAPADLLNARPLDAAAHQLPLATLKCTSSSRPRDGGRAKSEQQHAARLTTHPRLTLARCSPSQPSRHLARPEKLSHLTDRGLQLPRRSAAHRRPATSEQKL